MTKVVPQGPFGQIKLYFEPEKRPAGGFWADKIVFLCLDNGGLKSLLVKLIRKPFLTDQINIQKEIQGDKTILISVLGYEQKKS